jgi:hypothetical protein
MGIEMKLYPADKAALCFGAVFCAVWLVGLARCLTRTDSPPAQVLTSAGIGSRLLTLPLSGPETEPAKRPCGGTSNNYVTTENCYSADGQWEYSMNVGTPPDKDMCCADRACLTKVACFGTTDKRHTAKDLFWDTPAPVAPCPDGVWQHLDYLDLYEYGPGCPMSNFGNYVNLVSARRMYSVERCSSIGTLRYIETPEAVGPPSPARCEFRSWDSVR